MAYLLLMFLGIFIFQGLAHLSNYLYYKFEIQFFNLLSGLFNFLMLLSGVIFFGYLLYILFFLSDSDCYIPYYGTDMVCP